MSLKLLSIFCTVTLNLDTENLDFFLKLLLDFTLTPKHQYIISFVHNHSPRAVKYTFTSSSSGQIAAPFCAIMFTYKRRQVISRQHLTVIPSFHPPPVKYHTVSYVFEHLDGLTIGHEVVFYLGFLFRHFV